MRSLFVSLAAAAALLSAGSAGAANLLVNGSFETRVVTAADSCQGIAWCVRSAASTPGWTQTGDGVDLVHDTYTQGGAPFLVLNDPTDGDNFLDMNQGGSLGGLFQVVGATTGAAYRLSLDISAWAQNSDPGTVRFELYNPYTNVVIATDAFTETVENTTWDRLSLTGVATADQIGVRIYGVAANQAGMGVDNVVLSLAVPEPASWALMIGGFGLAGVALRRRPLATA